MDLYSVLKGALQLTGIPFADYAWDSRPDGAFGVIAIDGEADNLQADDHMVCQAPQGTIDLFTPDNDRADMALIQEALNNVDGCAWHLNSVQYEDDTRLLHWEWVFSLESW